ncbi:hypothetical protein PMZ80_003461 [Knufia obscura]|uniref:Uncharacterized protein n=1 Tax=Knufia obscura TaxID=1635080 RepID=A0ABR0RV77_9EURO|nr:hypothetical protein PMZ80_003461 [Knufia obscura]
MATTLKLPAILRSPTTLQYTIPKKPSSARPSYPRKFYPNDEAKATLSQPWLTTTDPLMPPYPHRAHTHFEEANHGLYGGATIQSGHKISDGRNKGKTLRKWYPNVRVEKLRSVALGVEMSIPTTARVMRTITKCGGLDEYLMGEKPARIKELGLLGWKLRWLVLKSRSVQERWRRERERLGLQGGEGSMHSVESTFAAAWNDTESRAEILTKMGVSWDELREKRATWERHVKETLGWARGGKVGKVGKSRERKGMNTLDVHDPLTTRLPDYVEEEEPIQELPAVQEGFGIVEVVNEKGGMQRRGAKLVNKKTR